MAKTDYSQLVDSFEELMGGKGNISSVTHCVTRVRTMVKDKDLVQEDAIKKIPGVVTGVWAGNQYQIVIGKDVEDVYDMICDKVGVAKQAAIDENLDEPQKKGFDAILDAIIGIIIPLIPMFTAGGIIRGILTAGTSFGFIDAASSTYRLFYALSWSFMYFAPIIIGALSANKFKCNPVIAMGLGAALVYPDVIDCLATEGGASLFMVPVRNVSYANTFFPIIMAVAFQAFLENWLKKAITNKNLANVFVPTLSLVVPGTLLFTVFGPIGGLFGDALSSLYNLLLNLNPIICGAFMGLIWQVLCMLGVHASFLPVMLSEIAATGLSTFCAFISPSCWCQYVAPIGVALKTKDAELKSSCYSMTLAGIFGNVTEPALYGINFRFKKPFVIAVLGGCIGGAITGMLGSYSEGLAQFGIYNFTTYLSSGLWKILLAIGVSCAFTIVGTYLFGYDDSMLENE